MGQYLSHGWRRPRVSRWVLLGAATAALMLVPRRAVEPFRLASAAGLRPFQWVAEKIRGAGEKLFTKRDTAAEVEREYWKSRVAYLMAKDDERRRQAQGVKELRDVDPLAVDVIAAPVIVPSDISLWRKSITLGRGKSDGVRRGMAVVWGYHYVGRVAEAGAWTSRVDLVTTPGYRVGGVLVPNVHGEAPGEARRMGIVEGAGGDRCRMKWVLDATGVADGWFAVTAGNPLDGTPRGLILGRVKIGGRRDGAFAAIDVEPEINLDSLDQVLILPLPE